MSSREDGEQPFQSFLPLIVVRCHDVPLAAIEERPWEYGRAVDDLATLWLASSGDVKTRAWSALVRVATYVPDDSFAAVAARVGDPETNEGIVIQTALWQWVHVRRATLLEMSQRADGLERCLCGEMALLGGTAGLAPGVTIELALEVIEALGLYKLENIATAMRAMLERQPRSSFDAWWVYGRDAEVLERSHKRARWLLATP